MNLVVSSHYPEDEEDECEEENKHEPEYTYEDKN